LRKIECLACLFLLIFGSVCNPLHGQDQEDSAAPQPTRLLSIDEATEKFLTAFRTEDVGAMQAIATAWMPDPFHVAYTLFGRHAHGALKKPPDPADYLDAAEALAGLAKMRKANRSLPALVAQWRTLDTDAIDREMRIGQIYLRINALRGQGKSKEAIDVARGGEELIRSAPPSSLAVYYLRCASGEAHASARRWPEAVARFREAARHARSLDWPAGTAVALSRIGAVHFDEGRLPPALAAWKKEAAVWEDLGAKACMAAALCNVGIAQDRMGRSDLAVAAFERALALKQELGDRVGAARVRQRLGGAWWRRDPIKARTFLTKALAEFRALRDRDGVARTTQTLGFLHFRNGELGEARELLEDALRILRDLGDRRAIAAISGNLGTVELKMGRHDQALARFDEELREYREIRDRSGIAGACAHIGLVHIERGEFRQALDRYREALAEAEALDDQTSINLFRHQIAVAYTELGRDQEAVSLLRQVLRHAKRQDDPVLEARVVANMGLAYMHLGEFARALEYYEDALARNEAMGRTASAAGVMHNIGIVHFELRRYDKAEQCFAKALQVLEDSGNRSGVATAISNLANVHIARGEHEEAADWLRRAFEAQKRVGDRLGAAVTLGNLGLTLRKLGRYDEARRCLTTAIKQQRGLGNIRAVGRTLQYLGLVHESRGELDDALTCHQEAREIAASVGDRFFVAEQLFHLAKIHLRKDDAETCLALATESVRVRLALGAGLGEKESLNVRREARATVGLGLRAARAVADAAAGAERDAVIGRAFAVLEWGRAFLLMEGLVNREALLAARLPVGLRDAESTVRSRVAHLQKKLANLAAARPADAAALALAGDRLDAAYRDLEEVVTRIQREARSVADVVYPRPIQLAALRKRLPEKAAVLLYHLLPDPISSEALLLVVNRRAAQIVKLGDPEEIGRRVGSYLRLVALSGSDQDVERSKARALYDLLIRPAEGVLAGADTLLVSPDGVLAFLPFEALLRAGGDRRERVLERWSVSYVPSGTVFAALAEEVRSAEPGHALLALGDPVYPGEAKDAGAGLVAKADVRLRGLGSLERLPASGDEVRAIAALFPGERRTVLTREAASIGMLRRQLAGLRGRLRALHLACHGHVDTVRPGLTGLVLSGGEVLSLHEVFKLDVPADLVVLSGCETGKGKLEHAEGVIGLVRGFFFAGAPRVLVTNWKVADEGARALMVSFYTKMIKDGHSPGMALRAAKLELLRSRSRNHPYHWAGFVLWGVGEATR